MSSLLVSSPFAGIFRQDFQWIDTASDLQEFCRRFAVYLQAHPAAPAFVDTEADSLHHFQEKLCLIQLAAAEEFVLIDPLAIEDISPLLALLEQSTLWLHGADYDLTLLKRTYGWLPPRIHDTQIAARLAGRRAFGLAALVQQHCDVTLCKSSQKADWSQRPLPEKMQRYAVDDVRYLPALSSHLMGDLAGKGRLGWFEQSCETLRQDVMSRQEKDREDSWRISGSGRFRPKGLALLRQVWHWRDGMARERDVPPFRILNNQQMLNMAREWEEHDRVTMPHRWKGKWRSTFDEVVHRLKQSDPASWPERPAKMNRRISDADRTRIDQLCQARDQKAEALGLESSLLGSRAVMESLVLDDPAEASSRLMHWQREVLGDILQS